MSMQNPELVPALLVTNDGVISVRATVNLLCPAWHVHHSPCLLSQTPVFRARLPRTAPPPRASRLVSPVRTFHRRQQAWCFISDGACRCAVRVAGFLLLCHLVRCHSWLFWLFLFEKSEPFEIFSFLLIIGFAFFFIFYCWR